MCRLAVAVFRFALIVLMDQDPKKCSYIQYKGHDRSRTDSLFSDVGLAATLAVDARSETRRETGASRVVDMDMYLEEQDNPPRLSTAPTLGQNQPTEFSERDPDLPTPAPLCRTPVALKVADQSDPQRRIDWYCLPQLCESQIPRETAEMEHFRC